MNSEMLKDRQVETKDREKADMIFSTVHKCKGMEHDHVILLSDFIDEKSINNILYDKKNENYNPQALSEEINVLYVAATRTRNKLDLPKE